MTDGLLDAKIKEALIASGHNKHDAGKLLLTWAIRDHALLLAMSKPHLKAIATGLIDHFIRQKGNNGGQAGARTAIDDAVAAAAVHLPMDERRSSDLPPPRSTERQASTMRKLVDAFIRKKE